MLKWHSHLFVLLAPCVIKQGLEIAVILVTLKRLSARISRLFFHNSTAGQILLF